MRSLPNLAMVAGAAVLAVAVCLVVIPFLARERDYPAVVPQPPPLYSTATIGLVPGARACWGPVVIDMRSERALIKVGTFGRTGPPLTLSLTARGFDVRREIPRGYADNSQVAVDVPPPSHDRAVTACVRNEGRRQVALYASDDRTKAPYDTRVDDRFVGAVPQLAFYERERHSIAARLPVTFERIRAFRFGLLRPWLLWPLALLLVLGVPLAALWAYGRAVREDEATRVR